MITSLRIQNVALIDEVSVEFAPGLNILTGETGAGKSIVVDSLGFLLGGRPARDFVRTGADFAHVEGIIETGGLTEELSEFGIEADEGQLMLSRTMQAAKSTCRINGRPVTAGLLKDVATIFVDLHGQNEHQSLLDPLKQLKLVDGFCGNALAELKTVLDGLLVGYKKANKALKSIVGIGNQRQEQIDLLKYQLQEIMAANIRLGEDEELQEKKTRLGSLDNLLKNTVLALQHISEVEGVSAVPASLPIGLALQSTAELARLDPVLEGLHSKLQNIQSELGDIAWELGEYREKLDCDPGELEIVEARIDFLYHIKKKYGRTIQDVLGKKEEIERQLNALLNSDEEIKKLTKQLRELTAEITEVCDRMHEKRKLSAGYISKEVCKILREVGMESAEFAVEITRKKAFGPDGNNEAQFLISANQGEPLKPLRRIASGGEMSRVMLAIKTVMAEVDRVSTVIFDEVDAGISGRTAQKVAEKLAAISRHRQILCITHLPQLAAMADTHFQIEKSSNDMRTVTTVTALSEEKSVSELARLIGGRSITDSTIEAAKEMRAQAGILKVSEANANTLRSKD